MRQLKVEFPVIVADMNVITPEKGLPHLPRTLKNITVEQAFDVLPKNSAELFPMEFARIGRVTV